jgi:hypothetical protein
MRESASGQKPTSAGAEPRDGVCKHPDVVVDDNFKITRIDGHQFSPERERACVMQTAGGAVRNLPGLHLKLDNGKISLFKDRPGCDRNPDTCERFSLFDYFPKDRLFLVHDQRYESDAWFLVRRRDGRKQRIVAPPGYSPGKRWLASVNVIDGPSDANNGFYILPADMNARGPAIQYRPKVTRPAEVTLLRGKWILNKWSPR